MMMTLQEIENKLATPSLTLDRGINFSLEAIRRNAILTQNENSANYAWCIRQVYIIKNHYLSAYDLIKKKDYEGAWHHLERADIELSFLEGQTEIDISRFHKRFMLDFIKIMIPRYQKLFPYRFFLSREAIIKAEKCSICGKQVSIRNKCQHKIGHLYMGEMCGHEVTDWKLIGYAVVQDPFDKYAFLKPKELEYNYAMVDSVASRLSSPYQPWFVEIETVVKPEYRSVKRNDKCPCRSGKKYKNCCRGTERSLTEHHKITIFAPSSDPDKISMPFQYVSTWK